jgi:hypothetical protein
MTFIMAKKIVLLKKYSAFGGKSNLEKQNVKVVFRSRSSLRLTCTFPRPSTLIVYVLVLILSLSGHASYSLMQ